MYLLDIPLEDLGNSMARAMVVDAVVENRYTNWHCRLNHPSKEYMRVLKGKYPQLVWTPEEEIGHFSKTCLGCVRGKLTQKPHYKTSRGLAGEAYIVDKPGSLIFVDLYFSNLPSKENHYVGIIVVDAFSKCIFTLTGADKSEAATLFRKWAEECGQYGVHIKNLSIIRSDNGGEFMGRSFQDVLRSLQISHERVPPYSHVSKAERAIRHLKENVRAIIEEKKENLTRAAMHVSKGHSQSPYLFWPARVPCLQHYPCR
jgi:hypothetical protein